MTRSDWERLATEVVTVMEEYALGPLCALDVIRFGRPDPGRYQDGDLDFWRGYMAHAHPELCARACDRLVQNDDAYAAGALVRAMWEGQ